MKNSKKLKLILQILICILISLIGIGGIYTRSSNMYKDILPSYILASDLDGITVLEFEVDESVDTVYYDKDGKEVDSTKITKENEKDYEKKEIAVNEKENLNLENYNETIDIMNKRLILLSVNQYQIDLDKETGKIVLSVEDDYIEDIATILPMEGKLQLIDSNTEDVVIDYTDIKSAESTYASLTNEIRTYISLKLTDSGMEKINDIEKYKTTEVSEESNSENEATKEEEAEESKLIVMFDTTKVAEVSYDDIVVTGNTARLTTKKGLTSDTEINSQLNMDALVGKLSTIGKMPVVYNLTAEEFVKNDVGNTTDYIVLGLIAISVILSLVLIIRYRAKGILAVLGFITNISIFVILIKLTKVQISLNGFAGIIGLIVLNVLLLNNILKAIKNKDKVFSDNIKNAYLKTVDVIVAMLIIFIIFSFSEMTVINTMGLLLFWGWLVAIFGTLIFTVPMLSITTNK